MYRVFSYAVALAHLAWLVVVLVSPAIVWWLGPVMLVLAGASNVALRDCPFNLWENACRRRARIFLDYWSMSRRAFALIGIALSEEQTMGLVWFLTGLVLAQSLVRWGLS